ncbi:tripartite tricarboxylate transporter substrate binding protein [Noviherbaspirillum sp. 1P10PC]|uniref:tripartite tricarboxylate transporter substrate binding protein n=1 Tax=Noviherbaspirillum sp. 1P10PC TaxID=3132292 RepID=UPI0039A051DA
MPESAAYTGFTKTDIMSKMETAMRKGYGLYAGMGLALSAALIPLSTATAQEASVPKLIKIVVPFSAGGSNDLFARALAQKLGVKLGTNVIVDNRPGAGGSIGTEAVARADADGATLLLTSTSFATNAAVQAKLPFDPIKSFAPVAVVAKGAMVLVVGNGTPYKSPSELIKAAKDTKNTLNYGSAGPGSIGQLSTELLNSAASTTSLHVPYKGVSNAVTDMIGGNIDFMITTFASVGGQLKSGQIRPIAVTSSQRSKFLPNVPAIAEVVPGYQVDVWWAMFAPAKTAQPLVAQLNAAVREVSAQPEMVALFAQEGAEPTGLTPDQTTAYVGEEVNKWKKLARERNISVN